jgi:hypothetical protein
VTPAQGSGFNLKKAIKRCKKKFAGAEKRKKRTNCIRKARKKAKRG